jgi:hypothetical protein
MKTIDIPVAAARSSDEIVAAIEEAVGSLELGIYLRCSLKSYPGSVHWHVIRPGERGTLEVTWWPQRRRLWLKHQAGRGGEWVDTATTDLASALNPLA